MRLNARMPAMVQISHRAARVAWQLHRWHVQDPWTLAIELRSADAALACELRFTVDAATGLLLRATTLRHCGEVGEIAITGALSLWQTLRGPVHAAHTLTGGWWAEAQAVVHPCGPAALELDSRAGKTGFEFQPWLALEGADGTHVFELLWSGN